MKTFLLLVTKATISKLLPLLLKLSRRWLHRADHRRRPQSISHTVERVELWRRLRRHWRIHHRRICTKLLTSRRSRFIRYVLETLNFHVQGGRQDVIDDLCRYDLLPRCQSQLFGRGFEHLPCMTQPQVVVFFSNHYTRPMPPWPAFLVPLAFSPAPDIADVAGAEESRDSGSRFQRLPKGFIVGTRQDCPACCHTNFVAAGEGHIVQNHRVGHDSHWIFQEASGNRRVPAETDLKR